MLERLGVMESPKGDLAEDLLLAVPELGQIAEVETVVPFTQDSAELTLDNINRQAEIIANNCDHFDGFVVIHGTDTMAYTASALSFMLRALNKPVIFTGSQRPFMQIRTDARTNLINSVEIATSAFKETAIFFGNKLLRGNRSTKVSTWKFEAFESPNFPLLGEAGMNINLNLTTKHILPTDQQFSPFYNLNSSLFIIFIHPGLQIGPLKTLLDTSLKAFIIVAYGAGNLPTSTEVGLVDFVKEAIEREKIVAVNTQCRHGRVSLNIYESARKIKELGSISCLDMTIEASTMKLNYLLSKYPDDPNMVKTLFTKNIAGELTEEK